MKDKFEKELGGSALDSNIIPPRRDAKEACDLGKDHLVT
jgi:hypothetical protein